MRTRKPGDFVYVEDVKTLRNSFASWLPCQVFKVAEHTKSSGQWYIWVESNSKGLDPSKVRKATPDQVKQYRKELKQGRWVHGHDMSISKLASAKPKKEKKSCWKEYDRTMRWDEFIGYMKPYREVRVGIRGGEPPFDSIFFKAAKKEVVDTVRSNRMEVTFSVMVNPNDRNDIGTMFISKMRMTLLDKNK